MAGLRVIEGLSNPQSVQPIIAIDEAGTVVRANFPARKALARAEAQPEGKTIAHLITQMLNAGGPEVTLRLQSSQGKPVDMLLVLSNEAGSHEAPAAEPQHTFTEVRLIDYIAHELRNPMGTVLGISRVLEGRYAVLSSADRIEALQTIQDETERALLILSGILKLAEGRTDRKPVATRVPLHTVLHRIVGSHRRQHPQRKLTLTGDTPLFAQGNSLWIELAVGNLLSNAEKYTPHDGEIEIAFQQNGSTASIMVMDRGEGLPPERYRTLWQLYERGAAGKTVDVSGSGIGLALCKELIEGMGGQVWAGPREDGGSVFVLTLPAPWDKTVPEPLLTPLSDSSSLEDLHSKPRTVWAA